MAEIQPDQLLPVLISGPHPLQLNLLVSLRNNHYLDFAHVKVKVTSVAAGLPVQVHLLDSFTAQCSASES
jgi:hypothetical protein